VSVPAGGPEPPHLVVQSGLTVRRDASEIFRVLQDVTRHWRWEREYVWCRPLERRAVTDGWYSASYRRGRLSPPVHATIAVVEATAPAAITWCRDFEDGVSSTVTFRLREDGERVRLTRREEVRWPEAPARTGVRRLMLHLHRRRQMLALRSLLERELPRVHAAGPDADAAPSSVLPEA
jgi:hypothetical protein